LNFPLLYEINTRCWLGELAARAGRRVTLAAVPDSEFDFWRRSGFTHLWLMGVWTLGTRGRRWSQKCFRGREDEFRCADLAGSPYAIAGYTVSRKLGGDAGLATFRRRLNAIGIKLVLDFIPNHTALDHPWVKAHPEFYLTSDVPRAGMVQPFRGSGWFVYGDCGHGSPWADTLQLDYRNPELRRAMMEELLSVAGRCDGVRCDMAMLALNDVFARTWRELPILHPPIKTEFWSEAIGAVGSRHRSFIFLAEVYWDLEHRLQELGFDFTYDKRLYDRLIARDAIGATQYLQSLAPDFLARSAHFIENHDEPRIASLLSFQEQRAAALLVAALPGMRLLHEGQLDGLQIHANVHFARRGAERADERIARFYDRLLQAFQEGGVGRGEWQLLDPRPAWPDNPTHPHFAIVQWQSTPAAFSLAVTNLGATQGQCRLPLRVRSLADGDWRLVDLLGDEIHERRGADLDQNGLYLDLPPHGAQLFYGTRIGA
jgi:hypothetical protein